MAENPKPNNEVERLQAENERLRGQVAEASARRLTANVPAPVPFLTEGERQELITFGVTVTGGQRLTLDQARRKFPDAELEDATDQAVQASRDATEALERANVRGVDYVWPSVSAGYIDPEVAGTPGINGPPAPVKKA